MRKGLTLVEMLFVIAIVATLIGLAVTQQGIFLTKSKDQAMSSKLIRAINAARSEASLTGMTVTLCKSRDNVSCGGEWENGQIVFLDPLGTAVPDKEHILYVFDARSNEGMLHWRSSFGNDYLQFKRYGMASGEAGTFWFCTYNPQKLKWAVMVNTEGRARLIYPDYQGRIDSLHC